MSSELLRVEHLKQYFPVKTGFGKTVPLKAVDDVSFSINEGETLGLVGESGCGKTTVGRSLMQLYVPTAGRITFGGDVLFDSGERYDEAGKPLLDVSGKPIREKRIHVNMLPYRKQMQMVFQDPYSSLDPRMTVEDIIGEPLDVHHLYSNKKERREKILELMNYVGLNAEHARRYAHEFSGGQRQRLLVARALAGNPEILILDDSSSALDYLTDAAMRAAIRREYAGTTLFLIAQRVSSVRECDQILVLDQGRTAGLGNHEQLMRGCPLYAQISRIQNGEEGGDGE